MSILFLSIQNLAIRSTPPHSAKFSPLLRKMGMTMSHQAAASLQLLSLLPVHGDSGRRKKSRQTPEDIWMCDHAVACEYELRCCATVKSGDGRLWPLSCNLQGRHFVFCAQDATLATHQRDLCGVPYSQRSLPLGIAKRDGGSHQTYQSSGRFLLVHRIWRRL